MIAKGGASKDELIALKESVEEVKADVDGEESMPEESGEMPMGKHKPGGIMIAIGLKKDKGEKE